MPTHPADREHSISGEDRAHAVREMFGAIAPRYDLLNHLLSLNLDRYWRRRAVDHLLRGGAQANASGPGATDDPLGGRYLDLCSGTLDLALELAGRPGFRGSVHASDFTFEMLERGQSKVRGRPVVSVCADALRLPYPDAAFDGATVGFGVRNLAHLNNGLAEIARVLKPGGKLVILEFTTPRRQPFRGLYLFYFLQVLPRVGRLVSRHSGAYQYLPSSVLEFPEPPELAALIEAAGFRGVGWQHLTGGIAALHTAVRQG